MRRIRLADTVAQRWRNGGGTTRELLVAPPGADAWRLRISVARIAADGPFSAFPGVQRRFALIDGAGVELDVGGRAHRIVPGDAAIGFDGDAAVTCRLTAGASRALNLMLRDADGALEPVAPGIARHPPRACCGLFARVAGRCRMTAETAVALEADELLWFDAAPQSLRFEPSEPGTASDALPGWWIDADA